MTVQVSLAAQYLNTTLKKSKLKQTLAVIGIIQNERGEFLLTKRYEPHTSFHGYWHLPGGAVGDEETPEQAIVREIKEELNCDVQIVRMIPRVFTQFRNNWKGVFICFVLKLINPHQLIQLNNEASEFGWYSKNELIKLIKLPLSSEIIDEAL